MECPTLIQIESSTACDAKCVFCPHAKLKRPPGSMSDILFEKILIQTKEMQIGEILLFLNGEPLIFPRLFDWLQALREYGFKTTIFTNANSMIEAKAAKLISYSDVVQTIVFSLGGVDKETYNEIMGLDYDRVRQNIEWFITLNKNRITTVGHCPYFSRTQPLLPYWIEHWRFVGEVGMTAMFNFAGLIQDELELKESDTHKRGTCGRLNHLTILYDGLVCLCCMDAEGQVILGDANEQPLIEIFNGPLASKYRQFHKEGRFSELPLCRTCNMNILNINELGR